MSSNINLIKFNRLSIFNSSN